MKVYKTLDLRYQYSSGLYQVKIAIHQNKKTDFYKTGIHLSEKDWSLLSNVNVPEHLKPVLQKLIDREVEVVTLLKKDPLIRPKSANNKIVGESYKLFFWFNIKIEQLYESGNIGTRNSYRNSKAFFKRYLDPETLLTEVTSATLLQIKNKLTCSASNYFKHLRHLRTIYNLAIKERIITKDSYPFTGIPQSRRAKKSLSKEHIRLLLQYQPSCKEEENALDLFRFSLYANGMNMKDISYLKKSSVDSNFIIYTREKSKNTSLNITPIKIFISPEIRNMLDKQKSDTVYQFPILSGTNPDQHYIQYRNKNSVTNVWLNKIRIKLKIPVKVTHGMARHSFATILKYSGVPLEEISESLGHSSTAVTSHYLSSFTEERISKYQNKLRDYIG